MTETVSNLRLLGFGEYEARAYVALLQKNPLNGYELAKLSGIPRADVYAVLQRLQERGAAVRIDAESGTRYAPVPAHEVLRRLQGQFQETLTAAEKGLQEMAAPAEYDYIANARGYQVVLNHARALLNATRQRLLIAIAPPEARALSDQMAQAENRGVDITTLCLDDDCSGTCEACHGQVYRFRLATEPENHARWLVIVSDQVEVLAGEIGQDGEALAIRTRQHLLVDLASWYVRHSIALATLVKDLGTRLEGMLGPDTKALLAAVAPSGLEEHWLERMSKALKPGRRSDSASVSPGRGDLK